MELEERADASPEAVWAALVDARQRAGWWSYLELDARPGGVLLERWTDGDGRAQATRGEVVEADPPRRLRATWRDEGWPVATEVTISLTAERGQTWIRLSHRGWDALPDGDALRAAHRDGWRAHLMRWAAHVA